MTAFLSTKIIMQRTVRGKEERGGGAMAQFMNGKMEDYGSQL